MAKQVSAKAEFNGETVAASDRAIVVEGNLYFPKEDVRTELLEPCTARSLCPWKGIASYYSLKVGEEVDRGAAWTYKHPSPLARKVGGRFAFRGSVRVTPE